MSHTISRRKFVSAGAITVSGLAAGFSPLRRSYPGGDVIRIGIIGTGNRGSGIASLLKAIPGATLIACCDLIPDHLQNGMRYAAKNAKPYSDHRKLLENKTIDAVIIATPLFTHYPLALDALAAGKHVYLEKSMTYDIPQALDLVQRVRRSNLVFQVGYQYRYYALYHRIKEIMSQNWLGKITHFECQYDRNSNWRVPVNDPRLERALNWRMYREYCGGPLSELCAHEIDIVNYLLDSHPTKMVAMGGINYWKDGRDTYDHIRTIYEYPGGIQSSFTSILSNAYDGYNIRIRGDKGTVEIQREKAFIYAETTDNIRGIVDGVTGATKAAVTQGKPVEIAFTKPGETLLEPTTYALQDFLACIRNNKLPASNAETAKNASIAILLGNRSADTESFQYWKPEYDI